MIKVRMLLHTYTTLLKRHQMQPKTSFFDLASNDAQLPIGSAQQKLLHIRIEDWASLRVRLTSESTQIIGMLQLLLQTKVFDGAIKLECLRTTGPLFRTYEPSDYRTFITESCKSRYRTYEPSDCRTFGMKNPLFRTHEPSDYRTFGLESSHQYGYTRHDIHPQ